MPVRVPSAEYYAWSHDTLGTTELREYLMAEHRLWEEFWQTGNRGGSYLFYLAYMRDLQNGVISDEEKRRGEEFFAEHPHLAKPGVIAQREFFARYPQYKAETIKQDRRLCPLHAFFGEHRPLQSAFFIVGFRCAHEDTFSKSWDRRPITSDESDRRHRFHGTVLTLTHNVETDVQIKEINDALSEDTPYSWPELFAVGKKECQPYLFGNAFWALKRSEVFADATTLRLLFRETVEKERRKKARLERRYANGIPETPESTREQIPEDVRMFVWRRDQGKCVVCGSNERLEFDHLIPVSKGGSNTGRNLQLLCERCNREKSDHI